MNKIFIIAFVALLCGCSKFHKETTLSFAELPKCIRDTMFYLKSNYRLHSIEDSMELNQGEDLIDFTGEYILYSEEIGPWEKSRILFNKKTEVFYKFPSGTPSPFIVNESFVFIPQEYNVFPHQFNDSTKFDVYKLR